MIDKKCNFFLSNILLQYTSLCSNLLHFYLTCWPGNPYSVQYETSILYIIRLSFTAFLFSDKYKQIIFYISSINLATIKISIF